MYLRAMFFLKNKFLLANCYFIYEPNAADLAIILSYVKLKFFYVIIFFCLKLTDISSRYFLQTNNLIPISENDVLCSRCAGKQGNSSSGYHSFGAIAASERGAGLPAPPAAARCDHDNHLAPKTYSSASVRALSIIYPARRIKQNAKVGNFSTS